jgi:hypothetical protein
VTTDPNVNGLALTIIAAILLLFVIVAGGHWDIALGIAFAGAVLWVGRILGGKRKGPTS